MGSKVNVTPEGNSLLRHRWFGGNAAAAPILILRNACARVLLVHVTCHSQTRRVCGVALPNFNNSLSAPTMSSGENSDFEIISGSESDNYAPAKKVCLIALSTTRLSCNV